MSIPKHLMEAKVCNEDTCKYKKIKDEPLFANSNINVSKEVQERFIEYIIQQADDIRKKEKYYRALVDIKKYIMVWYDFNVSGKDILEIINKALRDDNNG